jgi:SpoVK/Ycf46/Vps4 family AAA+-type ATPase
MASRIRTRYFLCVQYAPGKQGYCSLFHDPPGAGKTLTAALVGREFDMPVL